MRRSEINARIVDAVDFFDRHRFFLPPFAHWAPDAWPEDLERIREILDRGLGWDVTDFGQGRFDELGLLLFTLRNGAADGAGASAKPYAEKAMIVGVDQVTPMHYHWSKAEDIINRGGGRLMIRVYGADEQNGLSNGDVTFVADGVAYAVTAGHVVSLAPGESITLTPKLYHSFWAEGERVLAGEVSSVNDDERDNRFLEPLGRFPAIDEDEPPFRLLVSDYARFRPVE
jgi:D-lyxose ketol-isomerase